MDENLPIVLSTNMSLDRGTGRHREKMAQAISEEPSMYNLNMNT